MEFAPSPVKSVVSDVFEDASENIPDSGNSPHIKPDVPENLPGVSGTHRLSNTDEDDKEHGIS